MYFCGVFFFKINLVTISSLKDATNLEALQILKLIVGF